MKETNKTKGTEQFQEVIKNYLDTRAQEDELFHAKYATTTRTIEDVCNYIISEVQKSGRCGFSDMEIYGMATHFYDETDLEIGEHKPCSVVVNTHIDLTEEEKAEQKALALKRFQEEELRKIQERNARHKTSKPQEDKQLQPSLFDF